MGIAIAIVAVVALAVVGLLVTARSRATTGRLSRETRKRDEAVGASGRGRGRRRRPTRRAWSRRPARAGPGPTRPARRSSRAAPRCPSPAPRPPRRSTSRSTSTSSGSPAGSSSTGRSWPAPASASARSASPRWRSCGRRRAAGSAARSSSVPRPTPRTRSTTRSRSTTRRRRPTSSPTRRTTSRRRRRSPRTPRRSSRGWKPGYVALYQKCVHLGCRVPWCASSQWFECPCHGSKYNRVGEKQGGPAPRGLDRFALAVSGGNIIVDTGLLVLGPPIGTNTTGQSPEGAPCV